MSKHLLVKLGDYLFTVNISELVPSSRMIQHAPLVSAIITTHNRLELLPRAIDSVLYQTYRNIECIVVSDNSNDGTVEYCSQRKDIYFINIHKEESIGGNHARNVGILASKGKDMFFLDLDDYDRWFPEKN